MAPGIRTSPSFKRSGAVLAARAACLLLTGVPWIVSAAAPDLHTGEMQALRKTCLEDGALATAERTRTLAAVLDKRQAVYDRMLADQKRSGNITGMAVAKTALNMLAECRTQLAAGGDFRLTGPIRRELEKDFAALSAEKKALDDSHAARRQSLRAKHMEVFRAACAAQGTAIASAEEEAKLFDTLTAGETTPADTPAAPTGAAPSVTGTTAQASIQAPAAAWAPAVIAASGEAPEWTTVAIWFADVRAMDLFHAPVMEQAAEVSVNDTHRMNSLPYTTRLRPLRRLPAAPDYQFRVLTVPDRLPLEVAEWPTARNGWQFSFRARPSDEIPSLHGVEIQAGYPGAAALPLLTESASDAAATATPSIRIGIRSDPPDADIFVDGRSHRQDNAPSRTPCIIGMSAGPHTLMLRKHGYLSVVLKDQVFTNLQVVAVALAKDPAIVQRSVAVSSSLGWTGTGIQVTPGETLVLAAEGTWSCGSGREKIDADGYPNDKRFFRYYMDAAASPRQLAGAGYGALLLRIGRDGPIRLAGKSLQMKAQEEGELFLDINESPGGTARRDNSGSLTVAIQKDAGAR